MKNCRIRSNSKPILDLEIRDALKHGSIPSTSRLDHCEIEICSVTTYAVHNFPRASFSTTEYIILCTLINVSRY